MRIDWRHTSVATTAAATLSAGTAATRCVGGRGAPSSPPASASAGSCGAGWKKCSSVCVCDCVCVRRRACVSVVAQSPPVCFAAGVGQSLGIRQRAGFSRLALMVRAEAIASTHSEAAMGRSTELAVTTVRCQYLPHTRTILVHQPQFTSLARASE
jgi:hypothetical protein